MKLRNILLKIIEICSCAYVALFLADGLMHGFNDTNVILLALSVATVLLVLTSKRSFKETEEVTK